MLTLCLLALAYLVAVSVLWFRYEIKVSHAIDRMPQVD